MDTPHPEASLFRTLHKGRVYLWVAGLLLIAGLALVYLAADAMLFAIEMKAEVLVVAELSLRKHLYLCAAIVGPVALLLLIAGALLVRARWWLFILTVAVINLILQGVITYAVVDKWNEISWLQDQPHHFPFKKQLLDWHYFQFGVMALVNAVGYYAGILTLVILGRESVRDLFQTRSDAPAAW